MYGLGMDGRSERSAPGARLAVKPAAARAFQFLQGEESLLAGFDLFGAIGQS